jgi:hypothetical protein
MKLLIVFAVGCAGLSPCCAGPVEGAIVAAMKLSERPNYSWSSTTTDDVRTYDIEGRTAGGLSWVRLPMVKSIAQRLGREAEPEVETYFCGPLRCVVRTSGGWALLAELPRRSDWNEDIDSWGGANNRAYASAVALSGLDPWAIPPPPVQLPPARSGETSRYSNAQFALSLPHDELAVIVSSHDGFNVTGDVVTGTLTDLGAQLLLVREGQDQIAPVAAAGTFKLQLSRGMVTRYTVQLEGILVVDRKKVRVHQTSITSISRVGSTVLDVPEEVRRKLGP